VSGKWGDHDSFQRKWHPPITKHGLAELGHYQQTEQLVADLKDNKPLPPLAKVDAAAALERARLRFQARTELATHPLDQPAVTWIDQMLGPAQSTEEVFETLDRQYREQGKPAVWFLPLNEPIAPHLDELLGPVPKATQD
jgi:hypothetical protein